MIDPELGSELMVCLYPVSFCRDSWQCHSSTRSTLLQPLLPSSPVGSFSANGGQTLFIPVKSFVFQPSSIFCFWRTQVTVQFTGVSGKCQKAQQVFFFVMLHFYIKQEYNQKPIPYVTFRSRAQLYRPSENASLTCLS